MPAYASTFQDCQNEVIDKLRLDTTLDTARVKEWLNQTLVMVAVRTRYFSGSSAGTALTTNATSQALPTTLIGLEYASIAYGGQSIYMTPVGMDHLLMLRASAGNSTPVYYSLRKDTVEFWPNAQGTEVITYYGPTVPNEMTANSDVSGLPEPFASKLLIYGACVEAADFKNDDRLLSYYQGKYEEQLALFEAFLNARLTQAARAFPVYGPDGRPFGTPFLPHDPSSDYYTTGWRQ